MVLVVLVLVLVVVVLVTGLTGAVTVALCFHVFGIPSTWLAVKEKEEAKEQKIRNACKVERILRLMC